MDSIDPTINPPVGQQISHSESESYPEVDLGQRKILFYFKLCKNKVILTLSTEDHCPLNIAEEHLPITSNQPAILDVSPV